MFQSPSKYLYRSLKIKKIIDFLQNKKSIISFENCLKNEKVSTNNPKKNYGGFLAFAHKILSSNHKKKH